MKKIICIIIAAALLFTGCCRCRCSEYRPNLKDILLGTYENTLNFLGRLRLTSPPLLIGSREREDAYAGSYIAIPDGESGSDTVFGGISLKTRKLKVSVDIKTLGGSAAVYMTNGGEEAKLAPGEYDVETNGMFYISVKYSGFRGRVEILSEYE